MVETLTQKAGPLPVWAWAGLGTGGMAWYLSSRKKKAAATAAAQQQPSNSSNLGTVPVSNLTPTAQPMPIQMGDTFVNTTVSDTEPGPTGAPGPPGPPGKTPGGPIGPITPQPVPPVGIPPPVLTGHHPPPVTKMPVPTKPGPPPPPKPQTVSVCAFPGWCGSLWGIAQKFYGNGNLWPQIYNANKALIGANPNVIHVGQVLTIPPKS